MVSFTRGGFDMKETRRTPTESDGPLGGTAGVTGQHICDNALVKPARASWPNHNPAVECQYSDASVVAAVGLASGRSLASDKQANNRGGFGSLRTAATNA
jgi:hypothetical protein